MLTDTEIKKSKPSKTPYKLSDTGGLHLLVTPAGGKLWRWKYRYAGAEKLMSLGKYPDVSLAMARDRHAEQRRLLAAGSDPMAARQKAKQKPEMKTFSFVAGLWLNQWRTGKEQKNVALIERRLEADIMPVLGDRPIGKIIAPELVAMAQAIQERGALEVARRSITLTAQVFRHGIAIGLCDRNPAMDFRAADVLASRRRSNYARVDARDIPELLRAVDKYKGSSARIAIKLLALCFVRTSELIGARWAEIDMRESRWYIPPERMKMRVQHIVPLSRQALECLELLRAISGDSGLLFPGCHGPSSTMGKNTILAALASMGYGGRMTGHGFRGLASTILHEQGYAHEHIELQLAHAQRDSSSAPYNHALYLVPRTQMMQDWADYLDRRRLEP